MVSPMGCYKGAGALPTQMAPLWGHNGKLQRIGYFLSLRGKTPSLPNHPPTEHRSNSDLHRWKRGVRWEAVSYEVLRTEPRPRVKRRAF